MIEVERELQSLQPLFNHIGVAILQEIKQLEKRPEGQLDQWAEALHRKYTSPGGIAGAHRLVLGGDHWRRMSANEREVYAGRVQIRLINLATTGRISREEFDDFVRRLQGN